MNNIQKMLERWYELENDWAEYSTHREEYKKLAKELTARGLI